MASADFTIRVTGLREFQASLRGVAADLRKLERTTLRDVAKPIADDAERRALAQIRNIGPRWARMRVGITQRLVYVAPRQRGTGRRSDPRSRPRLAELLMAKAMEPALTANEALVVSRLDRAITEIGERHGF